MSYQKIPLDSLSPSSGTKCTGILSCGYDVGMMSSSIPGTKSSLCASQNIFRVSAGSVIFLPAHLTSLVIMNLLVSGLHNLYAPLVLLYAYPTNISLNVFYVSFFLDLSCLVTYPICPHSDNQTNDLWFFSIEIF